MAIGLYKPGQGYWVRVLTATLIGIVTLAGAAWVYNQMARVADRLPRSVWAVPMSQIGTPPGPGESVTLLAKSENGAPAVSMGTAVVESYNAGARELRIKDVSMIDKTTDPSQAVSIKLGAGQPMLIAGTTKGETAVNPLLLQGVAMAIVLLIGAMLAYYFVAMHQKFVDFLIATDGEMKKVNWSTQKDIRMSTAVVIFASVMLATCLFLVDFAFQWFFKAIGVLAS